jgi:hypothetical protein
MRIDMSTGSVMCLISAGVYLHKGDSYGFICFLIAGTLLSIASLKNTSVESRR